MTLGILKVFVHILKNIYSYFKTNTKTPNLPVARARVRRGPQHLHRGVPVPVSGLPVAQQTTTKEMATARALLRHSAGFGEQLLELAACIQLHHDIAATNKFAVHIQLRDCGPVPGSDRKNQWPGFESDFVISAQSDLREFFDPLPNFCIFEDIKGAISGLVLVQNLNGTIAEVATTLCQFQGLLLHEHGDHT